MPRDVVETISFWLNYHMVCSPNDESCDSFSKYYPQAGGTGQECGYIAFPSPMDQRLLSQGAIAGVAVGIMTGIAIGLWIWHQYRFQKQRRRYKKRFVQQIARNISIGPSPREIPAEKLAEEIQHIASSKNGIINKEDLRKWMFDIKLNFLSDKDFDALWNAIDVDGRGVVEPLEFFVFLSICGPEFEKVYQEVSTMPKGERLKWASRRLTNYKLRGEQGVRKLEHDLERRSRHNIALRHGSTMLGPRTPSQYGSSIDENLIPSQSSSTLNRSLVPSCRSSASSFLNRNNSLSDTSYTNNVSFQQDSESFRDGSTLDEQVEGYVDNTINVAGVTPDDVAFASDDNVSNKNIERKEINGE